MGMGWTGEDELSVVNCRYGTVRAYWGIKRVPTRRLSVTLLKFIREALIICLFTCLAPTVGRCGRCAVA